jgi:hypothetical protein
MSFQLSETLYPVDEVIGTFIQCILMRSSFDECLFWLMELLYTTPNICEGIVSIYQQFYSNSNKNVERYLTRKINDYEASGDIRDIADIVYNLREMSSIPTAYYISQYSLLLDLPSIIYKKPISIKPYPLNMHGLFMSLNAKEIRNIGVYAASSIRNNGFEITRDEIIKYADNIGKDITTGLCDSMCDKGIQTISYLLSKILNHCEPPKNMFRRANLDVVTKMKQHFETKHSNSYTKLREKRLYSTHEFLPPLKYGRFTLSDDFVDACRLHWEYYCFNSISWNARFIHYGGILDHNKRQILWPNDSQMDQFYHDDNYMDLDEQPISVANMSLHEIDVIEDPENWYKMIMSHAFSNQISQLSLN